MQRFSMIILPQFLNTDDDQTNSSTFSSTTLCEPTLSDLSLSPEDVLVCLRTLDVNKATVPQATNGNHPSNCSITMHAIQSIPRQWLPT